MPRDAHTALPHDTPTGIESPRVLQPEALDPARSPASRARAEEGVHLAYRAAGLPQPRIVWCRSPIEVAAAWAAAAADAQRGANVKCALFDRPDSEGKRRIERLVVRDALQAHPLLMHAGSRVTGAAVAEAVLDAAGTARPPLLPWLLRTRSHWLQAAQRPAFATSGCGPSELGGASLIAYIEEGLAGETSDALAALRLIAENAGWLVPHERACWLSERPDVLRTDARGHLHCASGPALRYRDGWSRCAWKGVVVPAWVIERPREITLDWIDAQIDAAVRHAMIDILTAERFIAMGGAEAIARDLRGTLWSREWTHRGTVIDRWRAVEYSVVAGTKPVFQPVPAHVQ